MTPWNFDQIPGLEEEKVQLRQLATQNNIPHALLFLGEHGSGNLGLALAFSRLVLCIQPNKESPCEECVACQKTSHWVHPDMHFSFPVVGAKMTSRSFLKEWRKRLDEGPYFNPYDWFEAQDSSAKGQGNINVEECKEIIQKMNVTSVEGNYKILLLWAPEFLGKEGNRLLKLIEEPPDRSLFLLVGADASRILPTILSRCQLIKVRAFRDEEITEALLARSLANNEEARQLAFLADGNLHDALRLAGDADQEVAMQFLTWLRLCYKHIGLESMRHIELLAGRNREDLKTFFLYGLHFIRQMLLAHAEKSDHIRLSGGDREAAIRLAAQFDLDRLTELAALFERSLLSIERNANAKILLLHISVQINALFHNKVRYKSIINAF